MGCRHFLRCGTRDADGAEARWRAGRAVAVAAGFDDTYAELLWLIIGAPEELEFLPGAKAKPDVSLICPTDPTPLPKESVGVEWPPKG